MNEELKNMTSLIEKLVSKVSDLEKNQEKTIRKVLNEMVEIPENNEPEAITPEAVTAGKLADDAVTTVKLADYAVTTDKLANYAVTAGKLDNYAVTTDKLANYAVTAGKLDNYAVTNGKIRNYYLTDKGIINRFFYDNKITDKRILPINWDINWWDQFPIGRTNFVKYGMWEFVINGEESNKAVCFAFQGTVIHSLEQGHTLRAYGKFYSQTDFSTNVFRLSDFLMEDNTLLPKGNFKGPGTAQGNSYYLRQCYY